MRSLLLLAGLAVVAGCASSTPTPTAGTRLRVKLPEFEEHLDRTPPRRNKLTVGGKERFLKPAESGTEIVVEASPDKTMSAELVLSFWPVPYSNTIRSRTVEVKIGEEVAVDLSEADPERPDRFEAIYFPGPAALTESQMKLADIGESDSVLDIGCGDGRIVIAAVRDYKAKLGTGVDIRQELVDLCDRNAKKAGVAARCRFRQEDALKMTDVSPYSVVFLYLGEDLTERLTPLLRKTLKPGSRVVSNTFKMKGWEPDEEKKVKCKNNYGEDQEFTLYLWRVK